MTKTTLWLTLRIPSMPLYAPVMPLTEIPLVCSSGMPALSAGPNPGPKEGFNNCCFAYSFRCLGEGFPFQYCKYSLVHPLVKCSIKKLRKRRYYTHLNFRSIVYILFR